MLPPSRLFLIAALVWLVGGAAIGIALAALVAEHGSVVYAMLGATVGVTGAVAHCGLLSILAFRTQPALWRAIVLWLTVALPLVLVAVVTASNETSPNAADTLRFVATAILAPLLVGAITANWLVSRAAT